MAVTLWQLTYHWLALRLAIENDQLNKSMSAKSKQIAFNRFHPAKVAAQTREVYLQAIEDFKVGKNIYADLKC